METPTSGEARPAVRLTVVSGPSGAGRRRVIELVRARSPEVWLSVPMTTRPRRPGEVDGVDYRFVTRDQFARQVAAGEMLEWAEIAGHRYGTPRGPVTNALRQGRPALLSVDPAGARQVRRAVPGAALVFLASPRHEAVRSGGATPAEFDVTIVADTVVRAADKLVTLLGSPAFL